MLTRHSDLAETVAAVRPLLHRISRGDWRLMIISPTTSRERDEAALLTVRLMELADAVEASRGR